MHPGATHAQTTKADQWKASHERHHSHSRCSVVMVAIESLLALWPSRQWFGAGGCGLRHSGRSALAATVWTARRDRMGADVTATADAHSSACAVRPKWRRKHSLGAIGEFDVWSAWGRYRMRPCYVAPRRAGLPSTEGLGYWSTLCRAGLLKCYGRALPPAVARDLRYRQRRPFLPGSSKSWPCAHVDARTRRQISLVGRRAAAARCVRVMRCSLSRAAAPALVVPYLL
jgi:hypothetical protein